MDNDPQINQATGQVESSKDESRKGVSRLLMWPVILFFLFLVFVLSALLVVQQSNPTAAGTRGSQQAGG